MVTWIVASPQLSRKYYRQLVIKLVGNSFDFASEVLILIYSAGDDHQPLLCRLSNYNGTQSEEATGDDDATVKALFRFKFIK